MKPTIYTYVADYVELADIMTRSAQAEWYPEVIRREDLDEDQSHGDPVLAVYRGKMQAIMLAIAHQRFKGEEFMFWVDADSIFLRDCAQDIRARIAERDCLFMDNGSGEINTGCFVTRIDDRLLAFWREISDNPKWWVPGVWTGFEEAACIEKKDQIRHSILPAAEYWSPCYPLKNCAVHGWALAGLPDTARMVHLGCVFPEDKLRVMGEVIKAAKPR